MSAETPGVASDKKQNVEAPTSKISSTTPTTTIPPFEKGGLGGIPREPGWIHHLDIWITAETEKKSGRGRSSGNGVNVYGIQKLRELILELAVRGKLVLQDPNDEPAGELIKRIQIEKAKLIAEDKIKKDKLLPPISDEEKPFELPQGWEWVKFIELLRKIGAGSTPLGGKQVYVNSGIPFLRSQNVWNEGLRLDDVAFITLETHQKMSGTHVYAGDLLFNITGASIGRCSIVPDNFEVGNVSQHVTIVRPLSKEILLFLHLVLISKHVQQTVMDVQVGVSREGLSIGKLGQFIIPIPPLEEQHRIVAKVDELMALCDQLETQHSNTAEAHEKLVNHLLDTLTQSQSADDFSANWQRIAAHFDTLFTTEASIDALKQTLLQLAVMGKLVPQDPTDEPASELLKRIQAEKARLVAEGKIKKGKSPLTPLLPRGETGSAAATSINPTTTTFSTPPLSNSTPNPNSTPPFEKGGPGGIQRGISEEEKPFELPLGWEWTRLGEITNFGVTEKLDFISDETWVLDLEDIEKDTSRLLQKYRFSERNSLSAKNSFESGDVLYGKLRPYLNKVVVADEAGVCTTEILPVRCYGPFSSNYFKFVLKSPYFISYVNARSYGMKMPRLGTEDGRKAYFPLPPLPEQHRIVTKVDELMSLCDQLKSTIAQASQLQKKLADVVVEQAIAS